MRWRTWLAVALLTTGVGCAHCKRPAAPCPPPCPPGPKILVPGGVVPPGAVPPGAIVPPGGVIPGRVVPPGAVPPGGVPPGLPPGAVIPPPDALPGAVGRIPTTPGPSAPAKADFRWTPNPDTKVMPPIRYPDAPLKDAYAKTPDKGPSRVLLFPPEISDEPPLAGKSPLDAKPPVKKSGGLPVGIPGFAPARDNVATGLRPSLDEGLDWLAANGYKTVLHVRQADEADSSDRKQVEKRGMRYLTLEVTPATLTRETADEFIRMVRDTGLQPLFVYDRDGALSGGLWYLYFRLAEELPEDAARLRAGPHGLRETGDMWEAARKIAP